MANVQATYRGMKRLLYVPHQYEKLNESLNHFSVPLQHKFPPPGFEEIKYSREALLAVLHLKYMLSIYCLFHNCNVYNVHNQNYHSFIGFDT